MTAPLEQLAAGKVVARISLAAYRAKLEQASEQAALGLLMMRAAWDVGFFAEHVMRPYLAASGEVSPPTDVDDWIYGVAPVLPGQRLATVRRLLLTGRGIGKTTKLKIRAFHGLLFGFNRVGVAIGATDDDGMSWVSTIRSWAQKPSPLIRAWFPELTIEGNEHELRISTRFNPSGTLIARGWNGSIRGLNVDVIRPDAVFLDDIEKEENSKTEETRDTNVGKLQKKILPLEAIQGGAEFWWAQTPVHHDGASARVVKGETSLKAWAHRRLPIVRQWPTHPDAEALWAENRVIYQDKLGEPDEEVRTLRAREHFEAHAEIMGQGAIVLDPVRMPIWRCYHRRWDVGESAWATEYEVSTSPPGAGVFRPDTWPRFVRVGSEIRFRGHAVELRELVLEAHYDPSDGGDDGALVVVAAWKGHYFVVASIVWEHARISEQIAEIPEALRFWCDLGLRELQWEPTAGSASEIEKQIRGAIKAAGLRLKLVGRPSTEKKESRIVATLEPIGAAGHLCLPADISDRLVIQAEDFDRRSRRNRDDWLDALQRAVERHQGRAARRVPDSATVGRALRNAWR